MKIIIFVSKILLQFCVDRTAIFIIIASIVLFTDFNEINQKQNVCERVVKVVATEFIVSFSTCNLISFPISAYGYYTRDFLMWTVLNA